MGIVTAASRTTAGFVVNSSTHCRLSAVVHATCIAPIANATIATIHAHRGLPAPSSLPTCAKHYVPMDQQ
jgi:hypothetical protein